MSTDCGVIPADLPGEEEIFTDFAFDERNWVLEVVLGKKGFGRECNGLVAFEETELGRLI